MKHFFAMTLMVFLVFCGNVGSGQMRSQDQDNSYGSLQDLSAEEREWYHKFQKGLLLFDGWEEISKEILASLPQHKQDTAEKLLQTMGQRIGIEWAKDNDTRRIDTEKLRFWGELLKEAQATGASQMLGTVRAISAEVNALLHGEAAHPTS
jgi:cation transport regulator ChaB